MNQQTHKTWKVIHISFSIWSQFIEHESQYPGQNQKRSYRLWQKPAKPTEIEKAENRKEKPEKREKETQHNTPKQQKRTPNKRKTRFLHSFNGHWNNFFKWNVSHLTVQLAKKKISRSQIQTNANLKKRKINLPLRKCAVLLWNSRWQTTRIEIEIGFYRCTCARISILNLN